ncbi:MAG: VCBS repeat-containing protein [Candidatus Eisenbacteria bacterium]
MSGPAADALGAALAGDGDVNGDGLSDLVVGAPGASTPELGAGRVQLYLNGASSPSWSYDAHTAGAHLGAAVANAGDVNGDGFADLLVSAPSQKVGGANDAGAAFLFLGKPNGPSNTPGWSVSGGSGRTGAGPEPARRWR